MFTTASKSFHRDRVAFASNKTHRRASTTETTNCHTRKTRKPTGNGWSGKWSGRAGIIGKSNFFTFFSRKGARIHWTGSHHTTHSCTFGDTKYEYGRLTLMMAPRHLEQKIKDSHFKARKSRRGRSSEQRKSKRVRNIKCQKHTTREETAPVGSQKDNVHFGDACAFKHDPNKRQRERDDLGHHLRLVHRTEIRKVTGKVVMTEMQKAHQNFLIKACQEKVTDDFV